MPDDAQNLLSPLKVDNTVKADAWEAYNSAQNQTDLQTKLMAIKGLPDTAKADLWELKGKGAIPGAPQGLPAQQGTPIPPELQQAMQASPYGTARTGGFLKSQLPQQGTTGEYSQAASLPFMALGGASAAQAPVQAATSALGSLAGGAGAKYGAQKAGLGPTGQSVAETGGQLLGGAAGALTTKLPFMQWLTASKTTGAQLLQQASAKAGSAPVELSPETDKIVEEITKQGKLGGTVPKVISDLLERIGPTTKIAAEAQPGPLTYDEARIVQGNASELSAQEQMALKGRLRYLIPQFAKSFSNDVQAAADQAGIGTEHALGMKEYAQASARNRALGKVAKYGAGATATTAAAGTAYEALKFLKGKQ